MYYFIRAGFEGFSSERGGRLFCLYMTIYSSSLAIIIILKNVGMNLKIIENTKEKLRKVKIERQMIGTGSMYPQSKM